MYDCFQSLHFLEIKLVVFQVRKDGDTYDGAWFGANVLSVKDGKALVCYTDIKSDEGSI